MGVNAAFGRLIALSVEKSAFVSRGGFLRLTTESTVSLFINTLSHVAHRTPNRRYSLKSIYQTMSNQSTGPADPPSLHGPITSESPVALWIASDLPNTFPNKTVPRFLELGNRVQHDIPDGLASCEYIMSNKCLSCAQPFQYPGSDISFLKVRGGGTVHTQCAQSMEESNYDRAAVCQVGSSSVISDSRQFSTDGIACRVTYKAQHSGNPSVIEAELDTVGIREVHPRYSKTSAAFFQLVYENIEKNGPGSKESTVWNDISKAWWRGRLFEHQSSRE